MSDTKGIDVLGSAKPADPAEVALQMFYGYMTVNELSEMLGGVDRRTIESAGIPGRVKVGRKVLYSRQVVGYWLHGLTEQMSQTFLSDGVEQVQFLAAMAQALPEVDQFTRSALAEFSELLKQEKSG